MDEYPLLVLLALIYIMPFLIQASTSFQTEPEATAVLMTIPVAIVFFVFQRRIMNTSAGAVEE